jgi:glycosyltransferase involved in cell wall biosynthesis
LAEQEHAGRSRIVVVIPTKDRPYHVQQAIASVYNQTVRPDLVVVVGEKSSDLKQIHGRGGPSRNQVPTLLTLNSRTHNLPGAVNSALVRLVRKGFEPESCYVSILDDDDWWEPQYLERCLSLARKLHLDWVVAGITRHEREEGDGTDLTIPSRLVASSFLRANPHVQGSNFFVRLSTLLRAGCFDENLRSTTDRDLGIRLVNLGNTKLGFVHEHLVHHAAYGRTRLSTPGSTMKRVGLVAFYQKLAPLMSDVDRMEFLHRAETLFDVHANEFEGGKAR